MLSEQHKLRDKLLKRQTYGWATASIVLAVLSVVARIYLGSLAGVLAGVAATAFAVYVLFWSLVHPRIYLGQWITIAGFFLSASVTYVAFGEIAYSHFWRQSFQLTDSLNVYQQPMEGWSVSYPGRWTHEEEGVSGMVVHKFKPSKSCPTMFFSVTLRAKAGTNDLNMVVGAFLENLTDQKTVEIYSKGFFTLPAGQNAYRILYSEKGRRIPLKNETLLVMDNSRLFYLTISAAPRWFDRHHVYLENLLNSLKIFKV